MKRTPLKRVTPLRRRSPLRQTVARSSPPAQSTATARRVSVSPCYDPKPVGDPLTKQSREIDDDYRAWISRQPCLVKRLGSLPARYRCIGGVDVAHIKTRATGGSDHQVVPLCRAHHSEQHTRGIKQIQVDWDIDLVAEAEALLQRYMRRPTIDRERER